MRASFSCGILALLAGTEVLSHSRTAPVEAVPAVCVARAASPSQHSPTVRVLSTPADERAPLPAVLALPAGGLAIAYRGLVELFPDTGTVSYQALLPEVGAGALSSHEIVALEPDGLLVLHREARQLHAFAAGLRHLWSQSVPALVVSMRLRAGVLFVSGVAEDERDVGRSLLAWSIGEGTWVHARDSLVSFRNDKSQLTRRRLALDRLGADSSIWSIGVTGATLVLSRGGALPTTQLPLPSSTAQTNAARERVVLRDVLLLADGGLAVLLWRVRAPSPGDGPRAPPRSEIWKYGSLADSAPSYVNGADEVWLGMTSELCPISFAVRGDSVLISF